MSEEAEPAPERPKRRRKAADYSASQELRARLVERGQWGAFCKIRQHLKRQGMAAKNVTGVALEVIRSGEWPEGFRPLETAKDELPPHDPDSVPVNAWAGKPEVSTNKTIEWVFNHILVRDVIPEMAPSPGAWALLLHVRRDAKAKSDFYKSIWPKTIATGMGALRLLGAISQQVAADGELGAILEKARGEAPTNGGT